MIRIEINEIKNRKIILKNQWNKNKSKFKISNNKEKKDTNCQHLDWRENIMTDSKEIKWVLREYYEQL